MAEAAVEQVTDASAASFAAMGPLLDRLEELLADVEALDPEVRDRVFELLDGVDAVVVPVAGADADDRAQWPDRGQPLL